MPQDRQLSADERRKILNNLYSGSPSQIEPLVGRSRDSVYKVRNNPFILGVESHSGCPWKLSTAKARLMLQKAGKRHSMFNSAEIRPEFFIITDSFLLAERSLPLMEKNRPCSSDDICTSPTSTCMENDHVSWTKAE